MIESRRLKHLGEFHVQAPVYSLRRKCREFMHLKGLWLQDNNLLSSCLSSSGWSLLASTGTSTADRFVQTWRVVKGSTFLHAAPFGLAESVSMWGRGGQGGCLLPRLGSLPPCVGIGRRNTRLGAGWRRASGSNRPQLVASRI